MELPDQIKKFKEIDSSKLLNPDFGSKNFNDIKPNFDEILELLSEMVDIAFETESFPSGLRQQVITITNEFNGFYKQILKYSIDQDGSNQFRGHQQIIDNFNNWYNWNYQGFDNQNKPKNFLNIYNACKNLSQQSLSKDQKLLKEYLKDAKQGKNDIDTILLELRKKSAEETVTDYAHIFKSQADRYSNLILTIKPFKINFGLAEIWFVFALLVGIGLVLSVRYLTQIFPIETNAVVEVKVVQLLTRLALVSFLIYLVSFCFKQYSISKHLFTLNKHRQNTLDSYKLFLSSIDREDSTTRNALMMEVAKSIYEAGTTGYITSKNQDQSPSIIEITRLIKDQK